MVQGSGCWVRRSGSWFGVLGAQHAERIAMAPARRPEELVTWQLASSLKRRVYAFTETGPASKDVDFRKDIRRAARLAVHNTAEGFYRYSPTEFAQFLNIARGSLGEVRDQLTHAFDERHLTQSEFDELV